MADETATPVDKKAEKLAGQGSAPDAISAHVRIDVLEGDVEGVRKDMTSLADSINNAVMGALGAVHERIDDMEKRVMALENFAPILAEHFAGRMGGTSDDGAAIFDAFKNADPEALKAALAAASTEAKSTETPPQPETQMPEAEDVPDHIKRAREMEAAASANG